MITILAFYFGINLGVFMVCVDMDRSVKFKQAIKHRGRLYSTAEYTIILLFGGLFYIYSLIKSFYDRA